MVTKTLLASVFLGLIGITSADADDPADLILRNGRIETVDDTLGTVEAVAMRGGHIVFAGDDDGTVEMVGPDTRIVDLTGRVAIPGFIEGHGHFVGLGQAKMNLDLMSVENWDEVIAIVEQTVADAAPGEWILGRGWHQEKWDRTPRGAVEGFPTHHDLSAVSPDNPVVLTHASGHASFANRRAMELSDISADTADPAGGEILRDEGGEPIGVFRETAQGLVRARRGIGPSSDVDRAIDLAVRECLAKGVTSFQDAGSTFAVIDALARRAAEGTLGVRLWVMVRESNETLRQHLGDYTDRRGVGDGFLTVGGLKRSMDGALGARGAWLLEPYADSPESTGLATATIDGVTELGRIAIEHDLQLCIHAIGDRANREVLDICELLFADVEDGAALRWRIEHAQHLDPFDIPRFGQLGVIASMQGVHCTSDGPWVYKRLGEKRAEAGAYVWQKLMRSGAVVTNGTDAPVEDVDPIVSYIATTTRRLHDGSLFFPEQRMTRMEALRSYTMNAAFAAFEETTKGSITPGKYGDIVVLSDDLLTIPEERMRDTRVDMTIVHGRVMFDRHAEDPFAGLN